MLHRIAELADRLLPTTGGSSVLLWDADSEEFTTATSTVPGQDGGLARTRIRTQGGTTRRIVDTRVPEFVGDVGGDGAGDEHSNSILAEFNIKAFAGIPIVVDDVAHGVLYTLDRQTREYTAEDREFLMLLAQRAGAGIVNARLLDEARGARERSEALAWVANALIAADDLDEVLRAVVEGVAAALGAGSVELVTVDGRSERVIDYVVGGFDQGEEQERPDFATLIQGRIGWVLREHRVAVASAGDDHGPSVAAPLRYGDSIVGVMTVERGDPGKDFSESEIDLVIAMASQAAVAIEHVRLLEATRTALTETESLYEVSRSLISAEGISDVLQSVVDGAVGAMPAHRVALTVIDERTMTVSDHLEAGTGSVSGGLPSIEYLKSRGVWRALEDGVPLRYDDGRRVVAPLVLHDRLLGIIEAEARPEQRDFSQRQVDMLVTLAAQAAVALDNARLFEEVQRLAITDELTGVHNRRHLFELAEREFDQAVRYKRDLAAVMFDIDRFKDINDMYGHAVGDEVLALVADRCADIIRHADVLGRYGGEEFAILLPETSLKKGLEMAERLRIAICSKQFETSRGSIDVAISAGVAELSPGIKDVHALIDRADAAMYFAKRTGRNRVEAG